MTPDTPSQKTTVTFDSLFGLAMRAHASYKQTYEHALDLGIRPRDLTAYAFGQMPPDERERFHSLVCQSPWALGRVVALVKADRVALGKIAYDFVGAADDSAGCEILDRL